jgi:hypothetical protein
MLTACLTCSSTMKMEEVCLTETSANFYQTTRRNISEDSTLLHHCCCLLLGHPQVIYQIKFVKKYVRRQQRSYAVRRNFVVFHCTKFVMPDYNGPSIILRGYHEEHSYTMKEEMALINVHIFLINK